jgi:hypothetical protein
MKSNRKGRDLKEPKMTIPQQNREIIRLLKRIDRRLELKWPMLLIGEDEEE